MKALLTGIEQARRTGGKVKPHLWERYNHDDVRATLNTMYRGLCCYCESRIGVVASKHIEHRKPKKRFPESTFSWDNLHLCCPQCNQSKGNQWDATNEILDSVTDVPISAHLKYSSLRTGLLYQACTDRGAVTIQHVNLNRDCLLEARNKVFFEAFSTLHSIRAIEKEEGRTPRVELAREYLRNLISDEYGTVIEFVASVLDDFLPPTTPRVKRTPTR